MKRLLIRLVATGLGTGYLPLAPGTWGSLLAVLAAVAIWFPAAGQSRWILAVLTVAAAAVGVWSSTELARELGVADPSVVVIDEIAGQWLSLLFLPLTANTLVAGFLLFRLFDIVKPFPVGRSESLPEGWGIVADDLIAGVYAGLVLWLARWATGGSI